MVFIDFLFDIFSGINMRYLGKVTEMISKYPELSYIEVSRWLYHGATAYYVQIHYSDLVSLCLSYPDDLCV